MRATRSTSSHYSLHALPPAPRHATLAAISMLLGALLVSGSASAARYAAVAEANGDTPIQTDLQVGDAPVTASESFTFNTPTLYATANSLAMVDTGGVHLTAVATAMLDTPYQKDYTYTRAYAAGGFGDQFVLQAPGVASGVAAIAVVAFNISGGMSGTSSLLSVPDWANWGTTTRWEATFSMMGSDGARWEGWGSRYIDAWGMTTDGTANLGTQLISVPVVFGETISLDFGGRAEAMASVLTSLDGPMHLDAAAATLLGNTISWGGFVELRDLNGTLITGFSAVSADTGFDYATAYIDPVPEPENYMLFLAGLGMIGWIAKHRKPVPG